MGAEILFLTNASGGINKSFKAGSFMMITDHISTFVPNPLMGPNIEEFGTRFPDMSHVYDEKLKSALGSPAEIRMAKTLGADAVGMSTVVEAIAANHMGMRICGVSCVCNLAAGISPTPLTHDEVQQAANEAAPKFKKLLTESVKKFV